MFVSDLLDMRRLCACGVIALASMGCRATLEDESAEPAQDDGDRANPVLGSTSSEASEVQVTGSCPDLDSNGVPDCLEECPRILSYDTDPLGAPIEAGERIEDAYAVWGIGVSTTSATNALIAFDSAHPTGGDPDLGTPNSQYGGPGQGNGGATNDRALGNLAILAENVNDHDRDGLVDDPDDDARGGQIHYTFAEPMCVSGMDLVDMEGSEAVTITMTRFDGETVTLTGTGLGDNSVEHFTTDECGVIAMDIDLRASGAIDNIEVCPGGGPEVCDGEDNDYDGEIDEDFPDTDGDGYADCIDVEDCDGLDNNGDGRVDENFADTDGDGIADCVDVEECDGLDNNGDGIIDEGFSDVDGDGIADCMDTEQCDGVDNDGDGLADEDFADTDGDGIADCVDRETCDGVDNDGDGQTDEGFGDSDNDGIADCVDTETCDGVDNDGDGQTDEGFGDSDQDGIADCVDTETCDGVDNNGNGQTDEGFSDTDGDGIADCIDVEECDGRDNDGDGQRDEGFPDSDGDGTADCVDTETCDGVDNDGDGQIDEGFSDTDGDGIADCEDNEECDGLDNDGDGQTDEGYADSDGDGTADCIDTEECDGLDNDGDGQTDEGFSDVDGDGIADCIDTEECDGLDNDGDGIADEDFTDTDGNGIADCVDVEICDGLDNDGDGEIDEGFAGTTYSWSRDAGFNQNGGITQELAANYNPSTGVLSFVAEIEHRPGHTSNGFTIALNNGPNPKGRGELALLYFDASGAQPVLTAYAYNGVNGFSSYYDGSDASGTQAPDRIASSLLDSDFVLDIWAEDDGTATSMGFVIDASFITDHTPMYVDEEPWYGIGFADRLGIWWHNHTNVSTSYTNGWLSSWSYGAQGWLDASNLDTTSEEGECPDECVDVDGAWSYYGAQTDESAQYAGGHAFIFNNLYGSGTVKMEMADDAVAFINDAGDLQLLGTAYIYDLGGGPGTLGSEWAVDATFDFRGTGPDGEGPNGPKLELLPGYQPVSVTDTWDYYDLVEAELVEIMGVGSIELVGNTSWPVQVGDTANGKNQNYGMATWFTWERFIAKIYQGTGTGDINVDFEALNECPDPGDPTDPTDPPGGPVDPPVPG